MRQRHVSAFIIAVCTTVLALTAAAVATATPGWVLEQNVTAGVTTDQVAPSYGHGRLAWEDDRGGDWDIYLADMTNGWSASPIGGVAGDQRHPAVSPDSPWVAYEDDRNGNWDIYAYNWETAKEVRVTTGAADQLDPAVSGTKVVYEDRRGGGSDIRMFDLAKGTTVALATGTAAQVDPAIAGTIVVWADRSAGNWDIVARDLRRNSPTRITTNRANETTPCIEGGRVVYADDRDDASDIYLYSLATRSERRITTHAYAQTAPAISGDWVFYQDDRAGNADIYCTNIIAGVEKQVTDDPSAQAAPAVWHSGDYPRVVWQDGRGGDSDIYFAGLRMPYLSAFGLDPAVVAYNRTSEVRCDFQGDDDLVSGALLWIYDWSKGVAHKTAQSADAADGNAYFRLSHLVRKTSFRFVFRGDDRYAPLAGPVLTVNVRASLSGVGWKVRRLSRGRYSVRIIGTIRPRHAAGSKVVKVAVYSVHGSSRSLKATAWATAADGSVTSSTFASTPVTLSPGAYQIRVVHDDADHALTVFDDDNGVYAGLVRMLM